MARIGEFRKQKRNANKHTERGLKLLSESVERDGWIGALTVAADGETFDGSARLVTAQQDSQLEPIVVHTNGDKLVIVVRDDIPTADDPRAKRLGVMANHVTATDWEPDAAVLAEIAKDDAVIAALTKEDARLAELLRGEAKQEPKDAGELVDKAAQLQEKWAVCRGDVWQVGKHRLMCGDSTNVADVARLMQGERAQLCFTSPPYNAGKTPTEEKMGTQSKYAGDADNKSASEYLSLISEATARALAVSQFVVFNLQLLSGNKTALIDYLYTFKEHLADIAIWDKQRAQPAMACNVLNSQFEFLFILSSQSNPSRAIGTSKFRGTVSNVYGAPPQTGNELAGEHSATFPVHLPTWAITHLTGHDEMVMDLFLGSGTTMVAAHNTGRICRGLEIEPRYCAVVLERMAGLGLSPVRVKEPSG